MLATEIWAHAAAGLGLTVAEEAPAVGFDCPPVDAPVAIPPVANPAPVLDGTSPALEAPLWEFVAALAVFVVAVPEPVAPDAEFVLLLVEFEPPVELTPEPEVELVDPVEFELPEDPPNGQKVIK